MCGDNNNKFFKSIVKKFVYDSINTSNNIVKFFDFSLEIGDLPAKYIELVGIGIHEIGQTSLYTIDINSLFTGSLLCHSSSDQSFMNYTHGLITSIDQKNLNGLIRCNLYPYLTINNNEEINMALYFVIHY